MTALFSTGTVLFRVAGYAMSPVEFLGTLLTLWSVWLVTRRNVWTWPVGNLGGLLFAFLFYQIRLYSDLVEQIYYIATGFYGWWVWTRRGAAAEADLSVTVASPRLRAVSLGAIVIGTALMGFVMSRVNVWWPLWFPETASYPYWDAFTTVVSFTAQLLMAHKKLDCWPLWVLVDVIGIALYFVKGVVFVSFLYVIFLGLALNGWRSWRRTRTA
ncbi:MAG TPA: nicotinamide riboside transporter PnuC [Elusimicrobiota bacterium]|nr:nicotinamide riboside transporter PnuC [Elusimicrobiota bacterium]HNC74220.1 nicotinamide riboside transporter PnuC [Elusimicrobiota bacterium]HND64756.1 nicotinamide riboside transporter PnuC [Elusimicrobiota bacterium]HNI57695.1 nicotinamide riboside transporter PnuC [Elusimicrobiota bacterium]